MSIEDLTGRVFNYLTVLGFDHREHNNVGYSYIWKCQCVCGKIVYVSRNSLFRGRKSCGCKNKVSHSGSSYHGGVTTHGMSKTRFYRIYQKMLERCYKEHNNKYVDNNIVVCDEWLKSFDDFKNDMYESYLNHVAIYGEKDTSIDRIDVDGNYCKENCRWATIKEQANNKSNNIVIEFAGQKLTLSQWADKLGWSYCTLSNRYKRGWDTERMLTEPPRYQKYK